MTENKESIEFGPIDAFHLADLSILRSRITKLLLNSPNHTHVAKDLVITLVSLSDFICTCRIYKVKGVQKPIQNGTSFLQQPVERTDQPWGNRESHPHKLVHWEKFHAVHSSGQDRCRRDRRSRGRNRFFPGWSQQAIG